MIHAVSESLKLLELIDDVLRPHNLNDLLENLVVCTC